MEIVLKMACRKGLDAGQSRDELRSVYTERDRGLAAFAKEWSK